MAWSELHLWTLGKFGFPRLLLASREGVVLAPHLVCPHLLYPQPKAFQSLSPTRRNLRDGRRRGLAELQDGPGGGGAGAGGKCKERVQWTPQVLLQVSGHRLVPPAPPPTCPTVVCCPGPGPGLGGLVGGTSEWTVVGARLTMKDKREMDVGGEAEAGRRNGRRVCWKVECTGLTTGQMAPWSAQRAWL